MISRRDFLKKSGQAALAVGGALTLDALLSSCATIGSKEARQDVINQKWEGNPIVPIPKEGCYIGGHSLGSLTAIELYSMHIGKMPAFWDFSIGKYAAVNDTFPKDWCKSLLVNYGVIPEVKYGIMPFTSFKDIARGKHDDTIARLAESVANFGKPFMYIPFKEQNVEAGIYWPHAGGPPKWFRDAWRHMHEIFRREGTNSNTVWALNYLGHYSYMPGRILRVSIQVTTL